MATAALKNGHDNAAVANGLLKFLNAAWTQFHAVGEASKLLEAAGFKRISEKAEWSLQPGGRYYFTRNLSTLVAFAVGAKYEPGQGFHMIGAHTDSPCLKLKPVSKATGKPGYQMVNVETYGGGLWSTWFDRDLSVAGRVVIRKDGQLMQRLVKIERPIMRIPMLAIHLNRDYYKDGFKPNHQQHLSPILATAVKTAIDMETSTKESSSAPDKEKQTPHHPLLLTLLAKELGVDAASIVDFELNVCDTQPGVIGGAEEEFVFVGRLDNLAMSYCCLKALVDTYASPESLAAEPAVKAIALFDHEEVGSNSAQGAGGPVMRDAITRITAAMAGGAEGACIRALQSSMLVSADMAHCLHPNYPDKHEPDHKPMFGQGLVVKHNANQRYATNSLSATLFREVARRRGIPTQEFTVRNDMACGSTIGPILASGLGCRTVDVGSPQLAMHSIREMCAVDDIGHAYRHFAAFFEDFTEVDSTLDLEALEPSDLRGEIEDTPCEHVQ